MLAFAWKPYDDADDDDDAYDDDYDYYDYYGEKLVSSGDEERRAACNNSRCALNLIATQTSEASIGTRDK